MYYHHNPKIKKKRARRILQQEELQPNIVQIQQTNNEFYENATLPLTEYNFWDYISPSKSIATSTLKSKSQSQYLWNRSNKYKSMSPSKMKERTRRRSDDNADAATNTIMKHSSLNQWPNRIKSFNVIFVLGIVLTVFASWVQGQPPAHPPAGFYDFNNLPETNFSCEGKVIGGYYADVETGCSLFHVCTLGANDEVQDIKFLCLNGTVFDQETRVCERVDEVDCSKAEQFYDLNLDLYLPHVATPKPAEPDLEEEDDFIRPVSTPKPPPSTTTTRTTTTTRYTTTKPTSSSRSRISASLPPSSTPSKSGDSNSNKGFSSFNYYLKTPHSHIASGYNSESQQSYIFNHNPASGEKDGTYSVRENDDSESQGRKIPSGHKTIVYTVSSSSTERPTKPPSTTRLTTRAPVPVVIKPEEYSEYTDEYYDDELPLDYEDSTGMGNQNQGSSKAYPPVQQSNNNPPKTYQQQQSAYGRSKVNSYDYRDGRSTSASLSNEKADRGGRGSSSSINSNSNKATDTKSHVSFAITSSKSTRSPPVVATTKPTPRPTPRPRITTTTSTRKPLPKTTPEPEPYYYDDDYPEESELQEQQREQQPQREQRNQPPMIIVRIPSEPSTTRRTESNPTKSSVKSQQAPTGPSGSSTDDNPDYYEEGDGTEPVNVKDHHFTHVDVPRIPYANQQANKVRVLVTNGKPFLPRLQRHIPNELIHQIKLRERYGPSFWDPYRIPPEAFRRRYAKR